MRRALVLALVASAGCMPPGGRRGGPGGPTPDLPEPQAIHVATIAQAAGYSQALKIGLTVYVAGQAGIDAGGRVVSEDLAGQAMQAVSNLIAVVHAAKGATGDIVKLTFYYIPSSPGDAGTLTGVVDTLLSRLHPPALTLVPVSQLPTPGLKVLVDGVAILRGEFPDRGRDRD